MSVPYSLLQCTSLCITCTVCTVLYCCLYLTDNVDGFCMYVSLYFMSIIPYCIYLHMLLLLYLTVYNLTVRVSCYIAVCTKYLYLTVYVDGKPGFWMWVWLRLTFPPQVVSLSSIYRVVMKNCVFSQSTAIHSHSRLHSYRRTSKFSGPCKCVLSLLLAVHFLNDQLALWQDVAKY